MALRRFLIELTSDGSKPLFSFLCVQARGFTSLCLLLRGCLSRGVRTLRLQSRSLGAHGVLTTRFLLTRRLLLGCLSLCRLLSGCLSLCRLLSGCLSLRFLLRGCLSLRFLLRGCLSLRFLLRGCLSLRVLLRCCLSRGFLTFRVESRALGARSVLSARFLLPRLLLRGCLSRGFLTFRLESCSLGARRVLTTGFLSLRLVLRRYSLCLLLLCCLSRGFLTFRLQSRSLGARRLLTTGFLQLRRVLLLLPLHLFGRRPALGRFIRLLQRFLVRSRLRRIARVFNRRRCVLQPR